MATQATSLRTRWLGERLRDERNKTGYTLRDAAEYLQIDLTSLGRFERGTHRIRRPYVRDLINFYGIADPTTREALLKLNEDSWRRDWWDGDTRDLEMGFIDYAWLESSASKIRHFETMLVPGLLQTRDYATAVMTASNPYEPQSADLDRLLDLRAKRQEILRGDSPTPLMVVLEEAVLNRTIGDDDVVREQLEFLVSAAKRAHIEIRIRPVTAKWQPGLGAPFTYFDMPDPYSDVAYVENIAGRTFLENEARVAKFRQAYDGLAKTALTPRASVRYIRRISEELE